MNPFITSDLNYILSDSSINWEKFEGKTILISGANGFLPAYMVETLLYANRHRFSKKSKILALVRNWDKAQERFKDYPDSNDLVFIVQDVSAPLHITESVDFIIHAASQASPKFFFSDPVGTINANTLGTNHLLQLAHQKSIESMLFFSTGEVYGDIFEKSSLVSEQDYGRLDPLYVRNSYGESKRLGETLCVAYHHQHGVPVKIVRPSHTYGPGFSFDDGRAFTSFVASVVNDQNIYLKSKGEACRSFIYLADAVKGYFTVLLNGENAQAYNVGNSYELSILDLAKVIIKASGKTHLTVEFDTEALANMTPSSQSTHGMLCINKLKKLGWQPLIQEEEGFKRTINSFLWEKEHQ
jgi:UDP-glucuronate decarboxylase